MNRTIKDATVKQCHYADHQQPTAHLELFPAACNHARRLKTLKGLTPHECVCRIWTEEPERLRVNPYHHTTGLNMVRLARDVAGLPASGYLSAFMHQRRGLRQSQLQTFPMMATTYASLWLPLDESRGSD